MNPNPSTACSRRSRARGLTLIEVVAAIAILGTLLVGIVLAKSRHTHQLSRAKMQLRAVDATDRLIAQWWASTEGVPIGEEGEVPGDDPLRWETRIVNNDDIAEIGARVLRVEVYDDRPMVQTDLRHAEPLVTVELVVPDPEVEKREKEEEDKKRKEELLRRRGEDRA